MLKKITPPFIQQLDEFLLKNMPLVWMSKIHYALWHGLLLLALSAAVGLIMPIRLDERIEYSLWYFLFTVIGVVLMCVWVYHYVIFNKEKNYGYKLLTDEYKNFFLTFFIVGLFLIIPWPFILIHQQRIAIMYTGEEVLHDINVLNESDAYIPYNNHYQTWYDSTDNTQYCTLKKLGPYNNDFYTPYFIQGDSLRYPTLKTNRMLMKEYRPTTDAGFLKQKINAYLHVAAKYNIEIPESADQIAGEYLRYLSQDWVRSSDIGYHYYTSQLNTVFNNICEAKFKRPGIFDPDALTILFYFIISITAFLLLFKITYWQQFLITIVVLILYPLLTFILRELLPYSTGMRGDAGYLFILLLLFLFSVATLFITFKNNNYYQPFYNIFNQVFFLTLMYAPMLTLAWLHESTNIFHNHDYIDYYYPGQQEWDYRSEYNRQINMLDVEYWHQEYKRWMHICQYMGIIVFVLLQPFFKELFIKQVALPKKS